MANESPLSKALGWFGLETSGRGAIERRSSLENPQTPLSYPAEWLLDIFNGGRTDSGLRVSEMTALEVTTVLQCVQIIANGIASHPLYVYLQQMADKRMGKTIAYDHPLFDLLHSQPNEEMTSTAWRRTLQCHALLWGNAYCEIQRDGANRIIGLWPRNPVRTRPVRLTSAVTFEGTTYPVGTMMYETYESLRDGAIMEQDSLQQRDGMRRIVLMEDMIHIPGLSLDGRLGQDTVVLGRQAIGLALAEEKYGAKFFGNGARPQGTLETPIDMTDIQAEVLRRSWKEANGGENMHATPVLPPGVKYVKMGAMPEEGQMLESRQHQKAEIASLFNVPGYMVGVSGPAGETGVEQRSIEFKLFCLDPWAFSWEQEFERKLFVPARKAGKQQKYFAGFDMRKLLYPTAQARAQLYGSGKQWGYLTTNDIRELEGLNPIPDTGDRLWMPTNMTDADQMAAHSDAVQSSIGDGTLAATPSGTTPVGQHPVVKDRMNQAKVAAKARQDALIAASANQPNPNQAKDKKNDEPGKQSKAKPGRGGTAKRAKVAPLYATWRDAVGRAAYRNKPDAADFVKIFTPLVSSIANLYFDEPVQVESFMEAYAADMFKRSATWDREKLDEVAEVEQDTLLDLFERA